MIKYNIRTYFSAILGQAFFTYAIIFLITQNLNSIDFNKALSHISTTISINLIIWTFFISTAWKWRIFYSWLVPFPNLSGDWEGFIQSNWKEKELATIPVRVQIKQSFFNIQVQIKTDESKSYSIGASFDIDEERGVQQLFYSYLNTPKASVRDRSEIHYGSTVLSFEGFKVTNMDGQYWTDRQTTGEIIITKVKSGYRSGMPR